MTEPIEFPSNLGRRWIALGRALGFRTVAPADVEFAPGRWVQADVLLPDFGGPRGMLLFERGEAFRGVGNDIYDAGYGLSVLRDPKGFRVIEEGLSVTIEVLEDWGWAGDPMRRPAWLGPPRPPDDTEEPARGANSNRRGGGISEGDMEAYAELNEGLQDPFPADLVRGKERHWPRSPEFAAGLAQEWHGHMGPVHDIPIKEDP